MKKIIPFFIGVIFLSACNNHTPSTINENGLAQTASKDTGKTTSDSTKYTAAMVDNAKDPVCGMPVTAGVDDTVHYNNKIIGFCSEECKDEFMKDAKKSFASVEWKKGK